jgi:hypothetical protein
MSGSRTDTVARNAAGWISRRGSLRALGEATLAGLGAPLAAQAKPSNRVKNKRARLAADRRCRQQVAPCQTTLAQQGAPPEAVACCEFLRTCHLAAFMECLTS